jgi:hypothetical protein
MASRTDHKPAPPPAPVVQIETVEILVAKADMGMGQVVASDQLQWQVWPAAAASPNLIRRSGSALDTPPAWGTGRTVGWTTAPSSPDHSGYKIWSVPEPLEPLQRPVQIRELVCLYRADLLHGANLRGS